jgi:hypothetical protein
MLLDSFDLEGATVRPLYRQHASSGRCCDPLTLNSELS